MAPEVTLILYLLITLHVFYISLKLMLTEDINLFATLISWDYCAKYRHRFRQYSRQKTRHVTAHLLCTAEGMSYLARFTLRFTWINYVWDNFVIVSNLRTIGSTYK